MTFQADWIQDVPPEWTVGRLKNSVSSIVNGVWGDDPSGDDNDIVCVRVADFERAKLSVSLDNPTYRNVSSKDASKRMVSKGDLLIEKSGGSGDLNPVGFVVRYEHDSLAVCSNFVARIKTSNIAHSNFFKYVHAAAYIAGINKRSIKQTTGIQNLDADSYLNELAPYPPLNVQVAIASFLDRETAKLDQLAEKKQRLIKLLQEKRQVLITQAVTKGLDPNVPMKDSGIPWLGEVPAHWSIQLLRTVVKKFVDYRGKTPDKTDSGVPLITARNVKDGIINHDLAPEFISEDEYFDWMVRGFPEKGDVIMTTEAPLGEVAQIIDESIALAQRLILFKVDKNVMCNEFLKHQFLSQFGHSELWSNATGSTALGIKADRLKGVRILVPSLEEQNNIISFLESNYQAQKDLVGKLERQITKIQEYRQALISAAVTGQIDFRQTTVASEEFITS